MKKRFKKKNIKQGGTSSSNYQQQGFMCIKSLSYGILLSIQLEAVRLCLVKKIKRKGVV
jgi:ribosomal protein L16/L10AE